VREWIWATVIGTVTLAIVMGTVRFLMGEGDFKRKFTISGIYAICKPENYDVVCFLDSDGKDGGMSCIPLSLAGGVCNPKDK